MKKIVINRCYGGFGLSTKAINELSKIKGYEVKDYDLERDDKDLVEIVERLGEESYGSHAKLKIVEIPDDVKWEIDEYDGYEHIAEVHRIWD